MELMILFVIAPADHIVMDAFDEASLPKERVAVMMRILTDIPAGPVGGVVVPVRERQARGQDCQGPVQQRAQCGHGGFCAQRRLQEEADPLPHEVGRGGASLGPWGEGEDAAGREMLVGQRARPAGDEVGLGLQALYIHNMKFMQWDNTTERLKKTAGWQSIPDLKSITSEPPTL